MFVCPQCARAFTEEGVDRCPDDGSLLYAVGDASTEGKTRLAPGAEIDGKYTLVHELPRRGGAGRTWIAYQKNLERHVELRLLPPSLVRGPTEQARFQREVQAWSKLHDDHLARLFDSGFTEDGAAYMALEIVEGGLAGDVLRAEGPLNWRDWATVALQSLKGLQAAHDVGVLHRDISPDAIVIGQTPDGDLHVRLTGFGLAKILAGGDEDPTAITQTGLFVGNPAYMAPEWMMKGQVWTGTDVFALGITLYELAAGARPVHVTTTSEALAAYVRGKPTPLRDHRPDTPQKVQRWMEKMIQFDSEKRFKTPREAHDALEMALAPDAAPVVLAPVVATPAPLPQTALPENWIVWAVGAFAVWAMAMLMLQIVDKV